VLALVNIYPDRFFLIVEHILFLLVSWSLVIYTWQLINLPSLLSIWSRFDISSGLFRKPYTYYHHSFFYTIHQFVDVSKGSVRNSGFCWEPGAFAGFIIIALYLLLSTNRFSLRNIRLKAMIYVCALLTTQSTMGYLAGFVILFYYLYNKSTAVFTIGVAWGLVSLVLAFVYVPFLGDKIATELTLDTYESALRVHTSGYEANLRRAQSIHVALLEFRESPIIGFGANSLGRWAVKQGLNVQPTDGLAVMLARYGLFLMIPFALLLTRVSFHYCAYFRYRGKLLFLILTVMIGLAFNIIETPLFLSLIFGPFFAVNSRRTGLISAEQKTPDISHRR